MKSLIILFLLVLTLTGCTLGPSSPMEEALFYQRLDNFNNTHNALRRSQNCSYSAGMLYCW